MEGHFASSGKALVLSIINKAVGVPIETVFAHLIGSKFVIADCRIQRRIGGECIGCDVLCGEVIIIACPVRIYDSIPFVCETCIIDK
jgi:hypothetical protein